MTFSPQLEERFAKLLAKYPEGRKRSAVVPMLIYAQDETGAVTQELIAEVAKRCEVTPLQVDEVVGYYSMLHRKPMGKFHVQVCTNISCLLLGGEELYNQAKKKLGIGHKEVTADGLISLEEVGAVHTPTAIEAGAGVVAQAVEPGGASADALRSPRVDVDIREIIVIEVGIVGAGSEIDHLTWSARLQRRKRGPFA